jgi:hypothetical protein
VPGSVEDGDDVVVPWVAIDHDFGVRHLETTLRQTPAPAVDGAPSGRLAPGPNINKPAAIAAATGRPVP